MKPSARARAGADAGAGAGAGASGFRKPEEQFDGYRILEFVGSRILVRILQ